MRKAISPWKLVVNALYFVRHEPPLSLDPHDKRYFWKYTLIASEKLKNNFEDIRIFSDKYSLENVLLNDNLYISVEDDKLCVDDGIDINSVNKYLDPLIKDKLSDIFREAYKEATT